MLQIAVFKVPDQQAEANEFLRTHKPAGQISFNRDMVFMAWEDGTIPVEYQLSDLRDLLQSVNQTKLQQEVALHIMKAELADLSPTHNKGRYEEVFNAKKQTEEAISIQDIKAAFVQSRINELLGVKAPANGN